jgi:hypothetical protein
MAGLKLLPLVAGVVDGGGDLMNSLWGLSLTGSSSAAAGDPGRPLVAAAAASPLATAAGAGLGLGLRE